MFGFIRKSILANKQAAIKRRYPGVNIVLHADMPNPSVNSMLALSGVVDRVNALEAKISALTDADLLQKSQEFRAHIAAKSGQIDGQLQELYLQLQDAAIQEERNRIKLKIKQARNLVFAEILPEAFAVVREAGRRTIGLRHFDVQIIGGIVLHEGKIAEMATGEGKTLVATLPAYLNALLGKGVHIVTVNDYLARRDREWMGPIYEFLGLSVGVIQHEMSDEQRQAAYACDITYGTNNEFGFDYLRDNMKYRLQDLVQRPFYYAIVDEVDSILVDEARTPLIISGPAEESTGKYYTVDKIVPRLKGRVILEKDEIDAKYKGVDLASGYDYMVDEKAHTAHLTEEGENKVCQALNIENLHDFATMEWRHHIIQALRAHNLYKRDVDYVIKEGQVIIVDEFTGRMMPGRRWSDGLHQAIEAKEGLKIERENQTLATITFQNYFRMYEKCAGMTGTAYTEANEFKAIYQLDVEVIPTNRPLVRDNYPDSVYKTQKEKFACVVEKIAQLHEQGRPVLVGTISIDKSEMLADMLKRRGIPHQVLNAKYHELEATIVAQAGRYKAVTIATNMAGRGTDILLGGNPDYMAKNILRQKTDHNDPNFEQEYRALLQKYKIETQAEHDKVVSVGGLCVIGTERHESRRIDNQLRGRCGRQGDPGASSFFVALQDDLMRLFGSDKLMGLMDRFGLEEGQVIEHPWVTKSIEIAQRRVEQHNFEIRKQLLEYDNVMNKQREVIYSQRRDILEGVALNDHISGIIDRVVGECIAQYCPAAGSGGEPDFAGLANALKLKFSLPVEAAGLENRRADTLKEELVRQIQAQYAEKEKAVGPEIMRHLERMTFLQIIDTKWKDHLYAMDSLREGISLRAYGQRDPLVEYKREAFDMFSVMMDSIEDETVDILFKLQPAQPKEFKGVFTRGSQELLHPQASSLPEPAAPAGPSSSVALPSLSKPRNIQRPAAHEKVGRNDPCPCGSGKKYKKCCGQ